MAHTRKRGANKANTTEISLGDLVLAKVLGFPAWPAKISRAEEWERAPQPKKYFVQFFGTQEIAFVDADNVQAFTHESRIKLLTRCQGKTVRFFAQAVKEICEASEESWKQKSRSSKDDRDQKTITSYSDTNIVHISGENKMERVVDVGPESCSHLVGGADREHISQGDGLLESIAIKEDATDNKDREKVSALRQQTESNSSAISSPYSGPSDDNVQSSQESDGSKRDDYKKKQSGRMKLLKHGHEIKNSVVLKRKLIDSADDTKNSASTVNDPRKAFKRKVLNSLPADKREVDVSMNSLKVVVPDSKSAKGNTWRDVFGNEALSSLAKHCHQELGARSDVSVQQKILPSESNKTEVLKKRKAIHLYDDDDGKPKTPVHGRFASKANKSSVSYSVKYGLTEADSSDFPKERDLFTIHSSKSSSSAPLMQKSDVPRKDGCFKNTKELESAEVISNETEAALVPPKKSPEAVATGNKLVQEQRAEVHSILPKRSPSPVAEQKAARYPVEESGTVAMSKTQSVLGKASNLRHDDLKLSKSQVSNKKYKLNAAGELTKGSPKTNSRFTDPVASVDLYKQNDSSIGGRVEDTKEKISSVVDRKASDSSMSIKHLIAVARNAHMQNISHGNSGSTVIPSAQIQGGSPSTPSTVQPVALGLEIEMQPDLQGSYTRSNLVSPSHSQPFASQSQLNSGDQKDNRHGFGHEAGGGSLVGGTDVAVNRDAFEGMIETLSRTKESIGRATRLAIICAKQGIANEVVDILVRKLENEPSFHRRVDLFFLVDSITQCSHSQRGVAGASYIPAVQAALPRLLNAAAPSGPSARDNRRQCIKVLRLWLERKILPELVLRRFMDDISASNEDAYSGPSLRRPSRSERGIDDPIREIEGMLDEYGSNAAYPLTGLSKQFNDDEEDEDVPVTLCKQTSETPCDKETAFLDLEIGRVTPNDRHHHILEDVDGELEMEDVSGYPKDEKAFLTGSSVNKMQEPYVKGELGMTQDFNKASSLEGSPPLPLEPPPVLPPLPSSPPPPTLPTLSSSHPSPPPPSLPPPLSSHSHPSSLPLSGPLQAARLLPSLPPHGSSSSFTSHPLPPHPTLLSASSTQLMFQTPGNEFSGMPSGNQPVQMVNRSQQSSSFVAPGIATTKEAAPFNSSWSLEFGYKDVFIKSQAPLEKQNFHPGHAALAQAPFHHVRPQIHANHYSYNKPNIQQNLQCPYLHPYSSPSFPNGRAQFVCDKQRSSSNEYKAESQRHGWRENAC